MEKKFSEFDECVLASSRYAVDHYTARGHSMTVTFFVAESRWWRFWNYKNETVTYYSDDGDFWCDQEGHKCEYVMNNFLREARGRYEFLAKTYPKGTV